MKKFITILAFALAAIATARAEETTIVDYGQSTGTTSFDLIWKYETISSGGVTHAVVTGVQSSGSAYISGAISVPTSVSASPTGPSYIVKEIASGTFANQIGITSVSIPVTIQTIGPGVFTGCTVLSEIVVDDGNPWFSSSAGALYDKDYTKIIACPARTETIQLPITLTEIGSEAFASCHRLLALNIPASVTTIGERAFKDCTRISSVTFEGNAPIADSSFDDGANSTLVFYKKPESTGWDASPWNSRDVRDAEAEQPSGVVSAMAGNVTWHYRVINGEAEIYNNGNAAILSSTTQTYTYDPKTFAWEPDGQLTIPSSLDGYPVTRIGDYAFSGCSALDLVSIPKSVRKVGNYAFANCTGISSLTIPSEVQTIGHHPFTGSAITSLVLPDSLRTLDGNPLAGCDTAISVSISSDNSYYATVNGLLYDKDIQTLICCPARMESVSIPSTTTTIGPEAFDGCFRLRTILLPDNLTSVGESAFRDATRLSSLVFPSSLNALEGPGLFEGCSNLGFVGFTGNAPAVDTQLFANAPASLVVYVAQGTTGWKDATTALPDSGKWPTADGYGRAIYNLDVSAEAELKEGDIFVGTTTNGTTYYTYTLEVLANKGVKILGISPKPIDDFEVPSAFGSSLGTLTVKTLGDRLFANSIGLLSVTVPNSITTIGDEVFKDCNVLASVTLAHGLRTIGRHPFDGTAIETIDLPDTVSSIDGNIFYGCNPSVSLSVGDNNPYFSESEEGALYDKDFENLYAVPMTTEALVVPATTTNIADEAFANCFRLKSISFLGNAPAAADGIFADTPTTLEVTVEEGSLGWDGDPASSAIPASGLWRDREITVHSEPPPVDSNTDGTWKWTVSGGVATLYNNGDSALLDTNHNGAVSVPAEVTDSATGNRYTVVGLGDRALYGCRYVTAVTLPSTIESIGAEPFYGTKVETLTIPGYVASIGGNPAAGCPRFTGFAVAAGNIDFSADAAGILYDAAGATLLAVPARATEIYVPASVAAMADDAFAGCTSLAKVNFIGNAPTAADAIFADTPAAMTSYAQSSASGFAGDSWKGRPLVITGGSIGPTDRETVGGLTWYYRVVDGVAEIWRDGNTAVESDSPVTAITLPATLGGYQVKGIGDGALANLRGITAISVPDTYEWIGDGALSNCTSLASISIPYGIRYIGERAFMNTIITEIELPDSVLDMGGNISAGTLFTSTIKISDSSHFKYSDDGALYNRDMTKLYSCPTRAEGTITIPNTVTNIAVDAFFGCHRLSYLNIPATVNTISAGAFNVAGIWPGLSAPEATPKLKTIFFNGPPPEAADDIFNGAPDDLVIYALSDEWAGVSTWNGRTVLVLDSANPPILSFTDETGITWFYRIVNEEVEIYNEDASGNPTTAVSPASTAGIAYKESEDSIVTRKALKIPDAINGYAVTKIGAHAFDGCKALIYVGIPTSVREICDGAFSGCASISAIGDSQAIPFGTADNTIDLPRGVTKLGRRPFEGIQASTVLLPYTLTSTDGNPVAGCEYVTSLSVDSSCPSFYSEGNILYNKRKNTVVAVPANYDGASVSFLDSVTTVGDEALFGCKNISNIQVPEALEAIGARAFAECESIKSLALADTLATIGDAAFSDCLALTKVTYAGNAPDAADDIYEGTPETLASFANENSGFTTGKWKGRDIVISSGNDPVSYNELSQVVDNVTWYFRVVGGVAEIWRNGATAVDSADPIMGLSLPTTLGGYMVKGIGDGALANLRGITTISIPSTYEWIGDGALSNCTSLTSVSLADNLRDIGNAPFAGTLLSTLTIPAYAESIDGNPAIGCARFTGFAVNADNIDFAADEAGVLYDADMSTLLAVPARATEATIPTSATAIADDAFSGCSELANITFLGNAPTAADGILEDTPEQLKITVVAGSTGWNGNPESDALPASGLWRDRQIFADHAESSNQEYDDGTVKWTYSIAKGKAVITGASGEAEVVTVPATLGGYAVSTINADALDGLSGVKAYKSASSLYTTKNGCLYSADGKTLIRVPDSIVLPYIVTTEVSSKIVTVTIVPGLKDSGNPGNDGTSVTTNITSISTSHAKEKIDGDISFDALLSGVTTIADHAFYGCNSNLTNDYTSAYENLSGETGFIGTSGDAYVRTSTKVTSTNSTYETTFTLPATVKTVGANAFEGSGVVPSRSTTPQAPTDGSSHRQELTDTLRLAESSSYIGWIEQNGRIVGTVTAKTGKARKGTIKTSGSVVKIGTKKTKIKNAADLENIDGLTLVKDLSSSKSGAAIFNAFKGKCWTVALMTSDSNAPLLDGYTTLSISAKAKGKVRIAGTAADGTKISASAQMVVDGDTFKIPIAAQLYSGKRGGFATVFTVTEEGEISVDGASVAFTAILNGAPVHAALTPIDSAPRGNALSGDISIWGAGNDEYSLAENLGWKPRYTKSSGQFKGKLYLIRNSDMKRVRATVTGVVANEIGYGTAVVKGVRSLKVEVK